jgi:hypothetical protein
MRCKQYTINAQYTRSIDCPKKKLKGKICMKSTEDCSGQIRSDQMVLRTVRQGGMSGGQRHSKIKLSLRGATRLKST